MSIGPPAWTFLASVARRHGRKRESCNSDISVQIYDSNDEIVELRIRATSAVQRIHEVFRRKTRARVDPILKDIVRVLATSPMPFALRTIAAALMALAVLLGLASSLPGKAALVVGPIETAICVDEGGREHPQPFDVVIELPRSPAVQVTFATQRLTPPALVPNRHRFTRTVLRL